MQVAQRGQWSTAAVDHVSWTKTAKYAQYSLRKAYRLRLIFQLEIAYTASTHCLPSRAQTCQQSIRIVRLPIKAWQSI
jgi:DNA-binding FadR family transcriptional regulator